MSVDPIDWEFVGSLDWSREVLSHHSLPETPGVLPLPTYEVLKKGGFTAEFVTEGLTLAEYLAIKDAADSVSAMSVTDNQGTVWVGLATSFNGRYVPGNVRVDNVQLSLKMV